MDTTRNRLIVWGGGHNDYAGNELYALNLNDLTIQRLNDPSVPTNAGGACSVTTLADGKPNSRHTYDGLAYMSQSDKMFVFGGSLACLGGYMSNDTWVFDFATSAWQKKNPSGTIPKALPGAVTAYDSATDRVFLHDDSNLYSYDLATDRYTRLATSNRIDYHLSAVIDPVKRKLVMIGGGEAWAYDIGPGSAYVRQTLATTGGGAIVNSLYPGLAFDPVSERIVAWHGGDTVHSLDLATGAWTPATFAGGPGPAQQNGTYKRWNYSPAAGAFVLVNSMTQNAYALRLESAPATTQVAAGPPPPPPSSGSTFTLLAPTTQTLAPFTIGLGFRKGDVNTPVLDIPDSQVVVMRRWNDGSVKHAIASGHVSLSADVAKTITASQSATPPAGTNLTAASIQAANPQASMAFGALGTVNLSSLLATPFRTFVSGPEMVEAHYRGQVGSDPTLVAWFHVRLYKGGRIWIRTVAENSTLDIKPVTRSYVPAVSIGGTQVWNNGGASLTHYANTRWTQEGWVGGDPHIAPRHNTAYLKSARLVPNFLAATADAAALNALTQSYAPGQRGNWTQAMGDTGYQDQIGLLPLWDALYIASGGDQRAYRSVVANAKALNSYPVSWTDSVTKVPVKPSDRPGWGLDGAGGSGSTSRAAGTLTWEIAHHGSGGYLAYLITGDYFHLETMEGQAATAYLAAGSTDWTASPAGPNLGTSRYFNGQTRGYAWVMRTLSQYVGIAPAGDAVAADYGKLLANNIQRLKALKDTVIPAGNGYVYEYDASLYGTGLVAPWQQHFFIQSLGMGSDLEPLSDMAAYNDVRDYLYRGAVGILGDNSGYCFTQASVYNLKSNAGTGIAPNTWYKTWAQVYAATFPAPPPCGNTLAGASGGDPALAARGYWGNLLPAIAYAVDHGAAGAGAAWARLTGATNWNMLLQSGFEGTPTWGVVPRPQSPPPPSPPPSPPPPPPPDTTPDAFTFYPKTGVALGTPINSNAITVTGINVASPIEVIGGTFSMNGGAFTSAAATVSPGSAVRMRVTSPGKKVAQVCATLTIGGVAGRFCVTTGAILYKSDTDNRPGTPVVRSTRIECATACIDGLDVDGDGTVDPQTDGMLILRRLLGRPAESSLLFVGPESSRTDGDAIGAYLEDLMPMLDIDGDGEISAATDGVLILRYLDGIRDDALVAGAVGPNATRTTAAEIEDRISSLIPAEALP